MSKPLKDRRELDEHLRSAEDAFVLFYASWCPFSLGFLPVFEKHAAGRGDRFCRMTLDGNESLFDEFGVKVYPTVLYFKDGKIDKRLDGEHLAGLREEQLVDLVASCETAGKPGRPAGKTARPRS